MNADHSSRIVVTGASGFIGASLIRRLRRDGAPVLAMVRSVPAPGDRVDGVEYTARDLEQVDAVSELLREGDIVVHLAGRAHRMGEHGASAQQAHRSANVNVARMLGRSMAESGARRLVFLSSAKVFGEGRERPYTQHDPLAPADAYAESKAAAEQVVRQAAADGGFEWTIVRPPFVYGRGGKGNFPRLVALARVARTLPLPLASVDNKRSIVFVGNLVDAIVRLGADRTTDRRIVLPTDGEDVSTPDLLRAIARADASHARLFSCPPALLRAAARLIGRSGDIERLTESLRLDSRYLREEFGWVPPFSLDRALAASLRATSLRGGHDAGE